MLNEMMNVVQVPGEPARRWFTDDYFDLIVWVGKNGAVEGFQLCYDTSGETKALTWIPQSGYRHENVDTGEDCAGRAKASPVLTMSVPVDIAALRERFCKACTGMEDSLAAFIQRKICDFDPCERPRHAGSETA